VIAFARVAPGGDRSVTVVARRPRRIAAIAADTWIELPEGRYADVLSPRRSIGERPTLAEALDGRPVALLHAARGR
jgi:hypothetical protein